MSNLNRSLDEITVLRLALADARECSRVLGAEVDRLRAENERLEGEISTTMTMRLKAENDRLRAEKAELIEMLATRTTHPEYVELLKRYRHENKTEAK